MLRIDYGCPDTCIWNSDLYFEEEFEMQWLQNPLNLRILREIDHAVPCAFGMQDIDILLIKKHVFCWQHPCFFGMQSAVSENWLESQTSCFCRKPQGRTRQLQ